MGFLIEVPCVELISGFQSQKIPWYYAYLRVSQTHDSALFAPIGLGWLFNLSERFKGAWFRFRFPKRWMDDYKNKIEPAYTRGYNDGSRVEKEIKSIDLNAIHRGISVLLGREATVASESPKLAEEGSTPSAPAKDPHQRLIEFIVQDEIESTKICKNPEPAKLEEDTASVDPAWDKPIWHKVDAVCQNPECSKMFLAKTKTARFCSRPCIHRARAIKNKTEARAAAPNLCQREGCGKTFEVKRVGQKYCSRNCSKRADEGKPFPGMITLTCTLSECGKTFSKVSTSKQIYCSLKCGVRSAKLAQLQRLREKTAQKKTMRGL